MVDFFIRRLSKIFKFFLKSLDKDGVSLYYVDVDVCVNIGSMSIVGVEPK